MTRGTAHPHEHVWDTETEEFSTFTPDPALDQPWVIHECIEVGCLAIKVTRVLRDQPGQDDCSGGAQWNLVMPLASGAGALGCSTLFSCLSN